MCKCTPEIRTPFCGKADCVLPGTDTTVVKPSTVPAPSLKPTLQSCLMLPGQYQAFRQVIEAGAVTTNLSRADEDGLPFAIEANGMGVIVTSGLADAPQMLGRVYRLALVCVDEPSVSPEI